MVILEYTPENAGDETLLSLVGKGIVYDSGGLSLKQTAGMVGMKGDMGGSAGCLAGFEALVKNKFPAKITATLCIAENAIGPKAYKNDDIVTSYSGKTMHINNTDAEGRVVLSDGVAYTTKHVKPLFMLDMATLTGAQLVTTGTKHAGILAKDLDLENLTRKAGHLSGDWTYPMLYAPELLMKEFKSEVADFKNSVKDRMNAQSSAAGHFIEAHFDPEWKGSFVHVDIAGPSYVGDRGTGYGAALIIKLAELLLEEHQTKKARGS